MSVLDEYRLRNALRWGSDREVKEAVKAIWDKHWNKCEAAELIASALLEERPYETREWCGEVTYDGVKVRMPPFPNLEIEEEDGEEEDC